MSQRKISSTNSINREALKGFCRVTQAMSLIEGRWKMVILFKLEKGDFRFSELKRMIPNISDRMLTLQLKALEEDGLITRTAHTAVPANVTYKLSDAGNALSPIWRLLEQWAEQHARAT